MNDSIDHPIIFLGPSLSLVKAKALLPHARYLPPIRCGDLLAALRLKPKVIAIIDGYFEHTAAVWHKEILYAIEQGVVVYGAASMGALRAAELHHYGMQGIGHIFEQYRDDVLDADDEVAVAHLPQHQAYQSLTDAMVNIRATLDRAVSEKVISSEMASQLCNIAIATAYRQRQLGSIAKVHFASQAAWQPFRQWLATHGVIDQKAKDAAKLLKHLHDLKTLPNVAPLSVPRSMFFRALQHQIQCDARTISEAWMPVAEQCASQSRQCSIYPLMKRLAGLLAVVVQLPVDADSPILPTNAVTLPIAAVCKKEPASSYYIDALNRINHVIAQASIDSNDIDIVKKYFQQAASLTIDDGEKCEAEVLSHYTAILWAVVIKHIEMKALMPDSHELSVFIAKFRQRHQLLTREAFVSWLKQQHLTVEDYHVLMCSAYLFNFIVSRFNIDSLVDRYHEWPCWWYHLASLLMTYSIEHIYNDK